MTFPAPRRRRCFFPQIIILENRNLLSVMVTSLGQDGQDLVGPDAAQGPDGIQISTYSSPASPALSSRLWCSAGGFEWATQPNPSGAALAEYFPSTTGGEGNLYINPQVKSNVAAPGTTGARQGLQGKRATVRLTQWSPGRD